MGAATSSTLGARSTATDVVKYYAESAGVPASALLAGSRAVVTGGNSGIGTETVKALAAAGATVVFGSRSVAVGQAALQTEIAGPGPFQRTGAYVLSAEAAARVSVLPLDLEALDSVRAFAQAVQHGGAVDLLVCNAGVFGIRTREETAHGFERQIGVNYLGHHYLISLLRPAMVARGTPARIVIVSSKGHVFGGVDVTDLHFERRAYGAFNAYGASKTALILEAAELADELEATRVVAVSLHPGEVTTAALRHTGACTASLLRQLNDKSIEQGAATTLFACLAPDTPALRGAYLDNCAVSKPETVQARDADKTVRKALGAAAEEQRAAALAAVGGARGAPTPAAVA